MNRAITVLVKIVVFFVLSIISLLLMGMIIEFRRQAGHKTGGFWSFVIFFGYLAGIRAIWRYEPAPKNDVGTEGALTRKLNKD